jgi:hypothetical protein
MKLKLSLLFSIMYASLWAQPPHTFPANGSLVVPAGITTMAVQAWGGGGAGGGAAGAGVIFGRGAAGGGGGAYAAANITVVAGNTLSVLVAGTTSGTLGSGAAGGNSTILGFESSIFAAGGVGGGSNTTGNIPVGGAGGTASASVGTTKNPGTTGGNGNSALLSVGLASGAGGTGATPSGGAGGALISSLILGTGPGNAGSSPGGGGSGAINSALGAAQIGGTGARGQVIISYTCPTYQINSTSAANVCVISGTSEVTITSSPTLLPIGIYTVTYNRSSPAGTALTAPMTVTTAGLGSFTANGFTTLGISNITITSLTSGVCVSNTTTNNTATVTVSPASIGGTVNGGTTICSGATSGALILTGHTGTVVKWQSSVSPFSTWTDIAHTATTYTSVALSQTTQFRAVVQSGACTSENSGFTTVIVNSLPTITLDGVTPVCTSASAQNTNLTYSGTTNSPTTYSILWNASPVNTFAAVTNAALDATPISIAVPAGTAAGTYTGTVTVRNANSCTSSPGVAFSVVVNPLPTITLGTVVPVCATSLSQNTILQYTGTTNSPTAYSIVWNASPANSFEAVTNAALSASPISIDVPAGTAPGTYSGTLTVTNANSCTSSPGINFSVLINELPAAPIVGAITPAACMVLTGSIALSGLPVGGTLTLYPGEIIQPYSGTTATISGLSSNTYAFTVSNGTCTSVISANAVVPSLVTNTYTTSWSNGTPTADQDIVFAGDFISAGDGAGNITACSCTINQGVNITIQALDTLTLTNSLSNNGGSVTFENNASLLQTNNAINTGNITYKRTTTPILRGDFVYWSTPVNPQRLFDVSPLTLGDKYLAYNGDRWVITNLNTNMTIGKGYIIRAPQNFSNTNKATFTASFIGQPNNGDLFGETVAAGKFYLIGNPYPSALDSDLFLSANLFLDGTLYFWTHNTPVPLVGLNRYNSDDYASYNFTGGVGIGTPAPTGTPQNNDSTPTGKIGAGQSFFATANNAGTVAFTNAMRLGGVDNSQFFKSENTSNSALLERHRLWLNMTNNEGAFKQTLIGYIEGATNDFENKYDGLTLDGNPYLDFYSILNDNKYVIQGRALPFTDTDIIPLGYRSTIAGDFTISIDHVDGDLSNHAIYIEDKATNKIHDLKTGNYTFSTSTGTYTDRFVLTYANKTLGSGEFEANDKNVLVAVQNKAITITSGTEKVHSVYIYDISGKMIYKATNLSDTVVKIDNLKVKNQVLLVKIILDTNETKTYKIVY